MLLKDIINDVKQYYTYDIETFGNTFTATFQNIKTDEFHVFVISHLKDDRVNFYSFLEELIVKKCKLIGFNNYNFDYSVIHKIIENKKQLLEKTADQSARIIKKWSNDVIGTLNNKSGKAYHSKIFIPQIDVFKINHWDNKNKSTSLKALEFVMEMDNIEEMPYEHFYELQTLEELNKVIEYNIHDVKATTMFAKKTLKEQLKMRQELQKEYSVDFTNFNDPKIGEQIFLNLLSKELEIPKDDLKHFRTKRQFVSYKDAIIKNLEFKTPIFQELLKFYQSLDKVPTENIKGLLTNINYNDSNLKRLLPFLNPEVVKETYKKKKLVKKEIEKLSLRVNNMNLDYGSGGIHGTDIKKKIWIEDDEHEIIDIDVTSYYPFLSIVNNFYPEHLGEAFIKVYKMIFDKRSSFPKGHVLNLAYKLSLNGSYGKSKDENSFLYDPFFTICITVNGQLLLSKLIEEIFLECPDSKGIQANTDGVTLFIKRKDKEKILEICKNWEEFTKLKLEYAYYKKMIMRDVNSYYAVPTYCNTDKIYNPRDKADVKSLKLKGFFEITKDWHKDHSMKIVQYALFNYFINNIPVKQTIEESESIFEFCKMGKIKSNMKSEARFYDKTGTQHIEKLNKLTRYIVTKQGVDLVKILPPLKQETETQKIKKKTPNQLNIFDIVPDEFVVIPNREILFEAGYKCQVLNKIDPSKIHPKNYNLDISYYINECEKVINSIVN